MKKIIVEAFEDPSRPQGGHAVILLRGVDTIPERPSIRLRPVEIGEMGEVRGLWRGGRIEPVTTRSTPIGTELVVGPDIVGHPHLLAGMPIIIEVPEADVRGEFLWPSVAPLAAPRRRHVVVPRNPRQVIATPTPANDDRAHLVTAADHLPLTAEADGNLALAVELASGAIAPTPAKPAAITLEQAEAQTEHAATPAHAEAPGDAHLAALAEDAPIQRAASPAPAAAIAATARPIAAASVPHPDDNHSATTAELDGSLTSHGGRLEPQWTPGRQRRGLAGNRLVQAAAAALVVGVVAYGVTGRRTDKSDVAVSSTTRAGVPGAPSAGGAAPKPGGPQGAAPQGSGTTAAAVGPAALAAKPAACDAPAISTEAMPAGRMRLAIKAACKASEEVHLTYGGADLVRRLDGAGALSTVVDAFVGEQPLDLHFADGSQQTIPVKAGDLDRVSKVAVIWRAPVNLDLHAFEYAALPGAKGHVWAGATGSVEAASTAVVSERRGRGFLSLGSDKRGAGDHVEVYTFIHAEDQASGSIGLALDYETRGEKPSEATCGQGALAEVPYSLVVLSRGAPAKRESGIIAAAECGARLGAEVRFNQAALPILRIKK